MPIPAFDDPRSFLGDFGVPVVFTLNGGRGAVVTRGTDGLPLLGIFDERYVDAKLGGFDMATGGAPMLRCMAVDVAVVRKHDRAVIEGVTFYLDHDPLPDGHGFAFLQVSRDTDAS
ncbi:MAG TPA: hypothetical protein VGT79_00545 [Xanthomonadaceae bacterium]|nr:hypothetical protein [Xanthomonadaceae bacterium]